MEQKEIDKAGQVTKKVAGIHKNPVVKFKPLEGDGGHQIDGVTLNESESQYLLPHFLMLIVGKPGSGKSYLVRQLLQNPAFYKDRFKHILAISPSVQKLDLKLPVDNTFTEFNLDWLMYHVQKINEQQLIQLNAAFGLQYTPQGGMLPHDNSRLTPMSATQLIQAKSDNIAQMAHNARYQTIPGGLRGGKESRFGAVPAQVYTRPNSLYDFGWQRQVLQEKIAHEHRRKAQLDAMDASKMKITPANAEQYLRLLSGEQRQMFHTNMLILLDDCIGQIKRAEFDPKLSQLVMNRRHLLINGTISIIIVSQKFSLIPVRIRSNASWLIAFKLNPVDYNFIFEDMVTMSAKTWANVLSFIFEKQHTSAVTSKEKGLQEVEGSTKKKAGAKSFMEIVKKRTYVNMGIWVDYNVLFKNFEQLELN